MAGAWQMRATTFACLLALATAMTGATDQLATRSTSKGVFDLPPLATAMKGATDQLATRSTSKGVFDLPLLRRQGAFKKK